MRFNIPTKLTLLVLALGAVALTLASALVLERRAEIAATEKERLGVDYLRGLYSLFQHVENHRGMAAGRFAGLDDSGLAGLRPLIAADLATLRSSAGRLDLGSTATDTFSTVERNWNNIAERFESFDAEQSFGAHGRILEDLVNLSLVAGEEAGLRTSPDLATFYLADAAMVRLLAVASSVGRMESRAVGLAAAGNLTEEDRGELLATQAAIRTDLEAIDRNLELAFVQGMGLRQDGEQTWRTANNRIGVLLASIDQELLRNADLATVSPGNFASAGAEALDKLFAVAAFDLTALDRLLDTRTATLNRQLYQVAIGLTVGILLAGLLAWLIARGVTLQMGEITSVMQQIGIGNYAARAKVRTQDELGLVARTLNGMLDSTLLLIQSREERDENLQRIIGEVQDTATEVGGTADQIRSRTEDLAAGSDAQSAQITEATEAIGRMAASIQQVSANSVDAANVARKALEDAQKGAGAVGETARGMNAVRGTVQETSKRIKRLGESSQEIGGIAKLINDIAERTSMLAINASIQAASAGEHGRGFAVVATEVERLAERSADATKRIETLINTIQNETNLTVVAMEETTRQVVEGSGLADDAGRILNEIESVSHRLAELIDAISTASTEQANTSELVANAMGEISDVSRGTAAGTRDTASSVRDLAGLLIRLRDSVLEINVPRPVEAATAGE